MINVVLLVLVLVAGMASVSALHRLGLRVGRMSSCEDRADPGDRTRSATGPRHRGSLTGAKSFTLLDASPSSSQWYQDSIVSNAGSSHTSYCRLPTAVLREDTRL